MNRFEQAFNELKKSSKKAIVPYIMAGDGGIECLTERLRTLEQFGATAIEVGVPFSDPVADGPTIQQAGLRALSNNTTLKEIITELTIAKEAVSVPILLMTYLNPVYAYGIANFVADIKEAGIAGCIIPDLPIEEEELIAPLLEKAEIELIRLVTMTTPIDRIKKISGMGKGFLYTVTVKGITGTRTEYDQNLTDFLKSVKEISPIPVLAGFGISNERQMKELSSYCDGVIVGSKIVDLFRENDLNGLKKLIGSLSPEHNLL